MGACFGSKSPKVHDQREHPEFDGVRLPSGSMKAYDPRGTDTKASDVIPDDELQVPEQKSQFQLRMEDRRSEIITQWNSLDELQRRAFDQQIERMQSKRYQGLKDVFQEYCCKHDGNAMDIEGLTSALSVFGMIIYTNSAFKNHIWSKFDLDDEMQITFDDFSATMATFVSNLSDEETLQILFEIFDIDQDGKLRLEDFARVLLSLNHLALVSTGKQQQVVYTKKQCIKQARKHMTDCDPEYADGMISFERFRKIMASRTDQHMLIDDMSIPSITTRDIIPDALAPVTSLSAVAPLEVQITDADHD